MKAAEFISKTKEGYEGMEPSLTTIYFDLVDAISEGCIEGVEAYKPGPKCMRVKCDDGIVWIWPGLRFKTAMDCKCVTRKTSTAPARKATPYERTRAAVYATGNRWAIENFNATH